MSEQVDIIDSIRDELGARDARLVAVSKTKPVEEIRKVYDKGQRIFGENRAQEMASKFEQLPEDIEWHMIGHLQRKKVKSISSFVHMIHSIDSFRLLEEVEKQAARQERIIKVLLQFKIATEESKYGLTEEDIPSFFDQLDQLNPGHIVISGVMGMASFVDDHKQIADEFSHLHSIFVKLKRQYFRDNASFKELSMGMSGDYKIALKYGSTLVRIGSLIFGPRNT